MRIICQQENLIKGLNIVSHIAGKNISLPILNNILLKAKNGVFSLISTNLEIGIKTIVRGKIEEEGEITAQAKLLTEYVSLLSPYSIELEKKETNLKVRSGSQEALIKGQEAEEYPIVPEVDKVKTIRLKANKFKQALSQVVFSASYEEIRPELSGVYFILTENDLTLVATDSYRLAEKTLKREKEKQETGKVNKIVPLRVLQEILRTLPDEDEKIEIGFNDNQVVFRYRETVVMSRLIEGNYPDYKEIIPRSYKTKVLIDKNDFIKIIKTASLFSKTGVNDVLLEFSKKDNGIVVSSTNVQLGENRAVLQVEIEGENNSVVFNYKYLLDGLQNIPEKKIVLEVVSSDTPVVLRPQQSMDYLYLIMPIRK